MARGAARPSPRPPEAPALADRVVAALARARALLGPGTIPPVEPADAADETVLESRLDAAMSELREHVDGYRGPDALEVVRVAYDVADLVWSLRERTTERRLSGLSAVQRGLAELRAIGSVDLMLTRSTQVACERCGFDRSVLFRVEGDVVVAVSAFDRRDPDWERKVKRSVEEHRPALDHMMLETEMLRRRAPAIVHDAQHDPRTFKSLVTLSDVRSYVAAPIMPEGRVIGFLHADVRYHPREVDVIDRDVLWAFAEGYGYALERTLLQEKVRAQRDQIREMLRSAGTLVDELGEADVQLARADGVITAASASRITGSGSRVHSLLTLREIEVMEMLAQGNTNKGIAQRLVLSEATIKSHVTNLFRKLHAANRAEAVQRYLRLVAQDEQ